MATVVRYIGVTVFGVALSIIEFLSPLQIAGLLLISFVLIVASFVEWREVIDSAVERIVNKAVEKAKERMKPVELDDYYLPLKETRKQNKTYFYDLKEMRG